MTQEFQKQLENILNSALNIFQVIATFLVAFLVVLWMTLCFWTFRDIQARTRDIIAQVFATLLVFFFNIPGVLLYILVRPKETLAQSYERSLQEEYMLQDLEEREICPTCRVKTQPDFMYCFNCRTRLRRECTNCSQLIKLKWASCPFCGTPHKTRPRETAVERERVGLGSPRQTAQRQTQPPVGSALATTGSPAANQGLNTYQAPAPAYNSPAAPDPRPTSRQPYADAGENYPADQYSYQDNNGYVQPVRNGDDIMNDIAPELAADEETYSQYKPPNQRRNRPGRRNENNEQDEYK